jgi:hypothetical protein
MRSSWTGRVAVSLAGIFVVGTGLAGAGGGRSAWEALVARDPGVVDDERVGWEERVALAVLTPEQAVEYRRGTDPGRLVLEDGRTLGEYLEARLARPAAGVYVGLSSPCSLFSGEWWPSEAIREVAVRGRCGVPTEALAAVLELQVETLSLKPARVKVWAWDLPEPAGAALEGEANSLSASLRTTTIVNLCAGEWRDADLRIRSAGEALLEARVVGYFRPLSAADAPAPGVSLYAEGPSNNFFGTGAGTFNTGSYNSFFGGFAGHQNTSGFFNSFFGEKAGYLNTTANLNSFFGYQAGYGNRSGANNSFFGASTGYNTTSSNNSFFGGSAGYFNTTGSGNSFFGAVAGTGNTTGSDNSFFGYRAGTENTTGASNAFFGRDAGWSNTTGNNNAFFGCDAGRSNSTGVDNAFFGRDAGLTNTTGFNNAFFGRAAGLFTTTGSRNAFFGYGAGRSNSTGGRNSFFGDAAGFWSTTGQNNAFFGDSAGLSSTAEHNNSLLGAYSNVAAGVTNTTALGYRAQVSLSNSLVLGSIAGVNGATASVNVGIGTPAPERQLHLKGNNAVFRMDRDTDTAAFMIVRTNAAGSPLKTFVVGTNAAGADNGEFVVNDLGAAVGGPGTRRMTITNEGEIHFTGIVLAPSFVQTSSLRFKTEVATLRNALETVDRLRGVSFVWRDTGKPSVGLIAEEVAEVLPEVVEWEENGLEAAGINYSALAAVLVEAVKAQRERTEAQQAELKSLRTELADLKSELGRLRAAAVESVPRSPREREAAER